MDRNGNVLAQSIDARYVYRGPDPGGRPGRDRERSCGDLLGIPVSAAAADVVVQDARRRQARRVRIPRARRSTPTTAQSVLALNLPGIGTALDQKRDDPGHDLAANLIGFTGTDSTGLAGLEEAYNSVLTGVNGYAHVRGRRRQPDHTSCPAGTTSRRRPGPGTSRS